MSGPLQTASSQSINPQPEVLYGANGFEVRLWTLSPGTSISSYPPLPGNSQCILLNGQLLAHGPQAPGIIPPGQHVVIPQNAAWQLSNPGNCPALWLEVFQGEHLNALPLREVTETRPWGSFTVLKDEPAYKLKQLMAKPGNRLSLQRHQHREEHWMVIRGQAEVTLDDRQVRLQPGEYIKIPKHSWHRLANPAAADDSQAEPVEIIELQLGDYFGEDDIERREDDYGRA
jgi:mannose-1-phosphate guanylyltransferase/mannose-6-phosphate isomerase